MPMMKPANSPLVRYAILAWTAVWLVVWAAMTFRAFTAPNTLGDVRTSTLWRTGAMFAWWAGAFAYMFLPKNRP